MIPLQFALRRRMIGIQESVVEHDYTITYSNVGGAVFIVTFTD